MSNGSRILQTAAGIFAGSVAVDAFKAEAKTESTGEKIALKAAGSLAAATSFHLLKGEAVQTAGDIGKIVRRNQLLPDKSE